MNNLNKKHNLDKELPWIKLNSTLKTEYFQNSFIPLNFIVYSGFSSTILISSTISSHKEKIEIIPNKEQNINLDFYLADIPQGKHNIRFYLIDEFMYKSYTDDCPLTILKATNKINQVQNFDEKIIFRLITI